MNFNDGSSNRNLDSSKLPSRAANEESNETGSTLDKEAMESAKRAANRMRENEQTNSSNTTFSK